MGWTWTHKPKGQSIKQFFTEEFNGKRGQVVDCAVINLREAYVAYEWTETGKVEAAVCLLSYSKDSYYNFGYRDMSEMEGPCFYNCPERILNLLTEPAPNEYAQTWREKCRKNLAKKKDPTKRRPKHGDVIRFAMPMRFQNGKTIDTFATVKQGRKTRFYEAYKWEDKWCGNVMSRYLIDGWTRQDYEIIGYVENI